MKIEKRIVYGAEGTTIHLSGDELAHAIDTYLVSQGVYVTGPRTVKVNQKPCVSATVFVDPSGKVTYNKVEPCVFVKKAEDFGYKGGHDALTINPDDLGSHKLTGWTIKGDVVEDHYRWVNSFEAHHPQYGRVWGDFEDEVFADSEEGFNHFYEDHPPASWDYYDI